MERELFVEVGQFSHGRYFDFLLFVLTSSQMHDALEELEQNAGNIVEVNEHRVIVYADGEEHDELVRRVLSRVLEIKVTLMAGTG